MKKREDALIDGVRYSFERQLGQGGTATVWQVHSSADGKSYALKRISKESDRRNDRFRNEIAFGRSSKHRHVVRIHAQSENATHFHYVMDLYPKSLRQVIDDESDYDVLLEYLVQLCDGLAYVHAQGVVHRDVKPENILVDTEERRLALADFGIAHFKDSTLTRRNEVLANRNYQAPEQMVRGSADRIGAPADVFAVGLIATEMFTKQNSRGSRHRRVADVHPFLADLDLLIERMMLQDESQRIGIEAACDRLRVIRGAIQRRAEEIADQLRDGDTRKAEIIPGADAVFERAAQDVLSATNIFERSSPEELRRYNSNYHCEIGYRVSTELFNACVQSRLYDRCKTMFEYEGGGSWSDEDFGYVRSPVKARLQSELASILARHPVEPGSPWDHLAQQTLHYFRFCKDYHCEEILGTARQLIAGTGDGSLRRNLLDAPILWIAAALRRDLATESFTITQENLERVEFERHIRVNWASTVPDDPDRIRAGADLFSDEPATRSNEQILDSFTSSWNASVAAAGGGAYWVHFRSRAEFERFRTEALGMTDPDSPFAADVHDLLRTAVPYGELVALTWEPVFEIAVTLAKALKLRGLEPARN